MENIINKNFNSIYEILIGIENKLLVDEVNIKDINKDIGQMNIIIGELAEKILNFKSSASQEDFIKAYVEANIDKTYSEIIKKCDNVCDLMRKSQRKKIQTKYIYFTFYKMVIRQIVDDLNERIAFEIMDSSMKFLDESNFDESEDLNTNNPKVGAIYSCRLEDLTNVYDLDFDIQIKNKNNSDITLLKYLGDNKFLEYFTETVVYVNKGYDNFKWFNSFNGFLAISPENLVDINALSNEEYEKVLTYFYSEVESSENFKDIIETYEKEINDAAFAYYQTIAISENCIRDFQSGSVPLKCYQEVPKQREDIKPSGR